MRDGAAPPARPEVALLLADALERGEATLEQPVQRLPPDDTPQRLKEFLVTCQLSRTPGEVYEYSNLGFDLLGHALAARASLPCEELRKERIAAPLGIRNGGAASPGRSTHVELRPSSRTTA